MNHCRPPQNWSLECGAVQIAARQKSSQTTDGQHLIRFCKVLYRTLVIENNPVRAGLAARPEDYVWSSAAERAASAEMSLRTPDLVEFRSTQRSEERPA